MIISDIDQLIELQDQLLTEIGRCDREIVISASFGLVRAYTEHRITNQIDLFLTDTAETADRIQQLIGNKFNITGKEEKNRWNYPQKVNQISFEIKNNNIPIKLNLVEDVFSGEFGKTKLEIGLFLEDLEGIYHRVLLDYIHNPENILYLVDIAYIDDEYHLIDFVDTFSNTVGKDSLDTLITCFTKSLSYIEKDRFTVDRKLREHSVKISSNVIKKWISAKIEELSE